MTQHITLHSLSTSPKPKGFTGALALLFLLFLPLSLRADCLGKIDVGPAYVHVDVLENQRTVKTMDLVAFKGDANFLIYKGFCIKPSVLYGSGHGSICSGGVGLGHCFPFFSDRVILTPSIGCTWTNLKTTISLPMFALKNLKERFRSTSPYLCLELTVNLSDKWRICGLYQYAWSRTHTIIKHFVHANGHSRGPNYGLQLEYDIAKKWSINLGAAYNLTLSKEKHGLRGAGVKLGIVRWL